MGMESLSGKMVVGTKGNGCMTCLMDKVHFITMKEMYIPVSSRMEKLMEMEHISTKTAHNLAVNLKMGRNMV